MPILRWALLLLVLLALLRPSYAGDDGETREHVVVRGIYGGVPEVLMEDGRTLADAGVNAVWLGERAVTKERVAAIHAQGAKVFAEFNTLHCADYLEEHPDAAPVGPDGERAEAPHGWQGICPTHEGYRRWRMDAFRTLLEDHEVDGVWLDYHHAQASWERADPELPDTCHCERCRARFDAQDRSWVDWRCAVLTDWVREFRTILDATRPRALLGTFHCPWSDDDFEGALRARLALDLRAQRRYLDVFSPMPYHARFGHADDPAWISRQTAWLASYLEGADGGDRPLRIWPIVQLSDWGETVPPGQVTSVLDHGTRAPASGVLVFAWGSLRKQPEKVEAMVRFYRGIAPRPIPLRFALGDAGSRAAPRYSPKGTQVALAPYEAGAPEGVDALAGRLPLGGDASPRLAVVARSAADRPYDRLWVDADGDGAVDDDAVCAAEPSLRRSATWTHFDATLQIGEGPPYAIGLWIVVEATSQVPTLLRFSRRSFLETEAEIDGTRYGVALSDADNDAVYGEGDWWALVAPGASNDLEGARRVGDFAWAGETAWRLELDDTTGRTGRLFRFDPGLTPEEDARARDPTWDDKQAERAAEPLAFRRDVEAAMDEARAAGRPCFLDFETTWCGPCHLMDRLVYTAKDVVEAAAGVVCVKIDGDERVDLKDRHGVEGFPTGILLGPDGTERARFSGYRGVAAMKAFFAEAARPDALRHVVVIGASASAGYGTGSEIGPDATDVTLADVLKVMITSREARITDASDALFLLAPEATGAEQARKARESDPSCVVAIDYLYWLATAGAASLEDRQLRLAAGLEHLEGLDCPVLLGELPALEPRPGRGSTASDALPLQALEALNRRIVAWADARPNVFVVPLPTVLADLRAGRTVQVGGSRWDGPAALPEVLQADGRHPTVVGLALIAALCLDVLVENHLVSRNEVGLDARAAAHAVSGR